MMWAMENGTGEGSVGVSNPSSHHPSFPYKGDFLFVHERIVKGGPTFEAHNVYYTDTFL